MKVVLDAGHTKGENRGSLISNEGDNNYHYSLVLKKALEQYDIDVVLTRPKLADNPTLWERGNMAKGADLFLSLHSNAYHDPAVNGIELFDSVSKPNKELATKIVNALAKEFRNNRGVKYREWDNTDYYGVLRDNKAKYGMLIEHGFHTNKEDVKVYVNRRQELADITADVIAEHYNLKKDKPIKKPTTKSINAIAKEVINGKWGNGNDRVARLRVEGYNPQEVQDEVNRILYGTVPNKPKPAPKPPKKPSNKEIAREVLEGKWGNGKARKDKLQKAGYNYNAIQKEVNGILYGNIPIAKSINQVANEVINGKWGNGAERKRRLAKAGYNYAKVQKEVNRILA